MLQNYNKPQTCILVAGKSYTFCKQNLCRYHPAAFFCFFFGKMLQLEWRQCCWDVFAEINVEYCSSGDDDEKIGLKEAGFT